MRVKAIRRHLFGDDRYLVVPEEMSEVEFVVGERTLAIDVICHASTMEWAERIASALNRSEAS